MAEVPAVAPLTATIARGLKRRGLKFLDPTTVHAHPRAACHVSDDPVTCFCHDEFGA